MEKQRLVYNLVTGKYYIAMERSSKYGDGEEITSLWKIQNKK
jgi:hypothetical protein